MPGMISGSFVIRKYKLESLPLYLSCGCLRMCFYTSCWKFANVVSSSQMTITARSASKFCASSRSECSDCFFLDLSSWWNFWRYRTLVNMSTWRIKVVKCEIFELIMSLGWMWNCKSVNCLSVAESTMVQIRTRCPNRSRSHGNMWVQAVNCKFTEINTPDLLKIHWMHDLQCKSCAKCEFEQL